MILPHIGIVGCSAEGAALCYRTICHEGARFFGPHGHREVSMHTRPLADYAYCLDGGDLRGVGDLMLSSAEKLQRAGAGLLICPGNTIHQAMAYVQPRSLLPWLHIAEVVADEAQRRGFGRLAITGTQCGGLRSSLPLRSQRRTVRKLCVNRKRNGHDKA